MYKNTNNKIYLSSKLLNIWEIYSHCALHTYTIIIIIIWVHIFKCKNSGLMNHKLIPEIYLSKYISYMKLQSKMNCCSHITK